MLFVLFFSVSSLCSDKGCTFFPTFNFTTLFFDSVFFSDPIFLNHYTYLCLINRTVECILNLIMGLVSELSVY